MSAWRGGGKTEQIGPARHSPHFRAFIAAQVLIAPVMRQYQTKILDFGTENAAPFSLLAERVKLLSGALS